MSNLRNSHVAVSNLGVKGHRIANCHPGFSGERESERGGGGVDTLRRRPPTLVHTSAASRSSSGRGKLVKEPG